MIEIVIMIAAVGVSAIATFAWKQGSHGPALVLYGLALYLGLQSIRSICSL